MSVSITGDVELDRKLSRLRQRVQTTITKAAVRAGLSETAKVIKAVVPSRYKEARKSIGWSFKKAKSGAGRRMMTARVGVAVGKKRAKLNAWGAKVADKRRAAGKKGWGVSPATLQMFVVGTKTTNPLVPNLATRGANRAGFRVKRKMRAAFRKGIMREAAKAV